MGHLGTFWLGRSRLQIIWPISKAREMARLSFFQAFIQLIAIISCSEFQNENTNFIAHASDATDDNFYLACSGGDVGFVQKALKETPCKCQDHFVINILVKATVLFLESQAWRGRVFISKLGSNSSVI